MNLFRAMPAALSAILLVTALAGCSPEGTRFVDEGNSYSSETVTAVFETAATGTAAGQPTSDAAELRQEALVSLRKQGGDAAAAADVLTRVFASSSPGVPYYVEKATFDGADALVVAEFIGPKGGVLKDKRIWVIDESGEILFSGTR